MVKVEKVQSLVFWRAVPFIRNADYLQRLTVLLLKNNRFAGGTLKRNDSSLKIIYERESAEK
ncbi:hypothetical protein B1748_02955 [Paenibacillus sp. MY03]|nr:hypothetical protein B1748_02955 [Paenibacillus sp. MY03]